MLAEWETLVNPGVPLPYAIRRLTGIDNEALAAAPNLAAASPSLADFVGADPIVGQSIELDIAALQRQGIRLRNRLIDTFELATLLLPGLTAYDLATVARALELEVGDIHRALSDARLSRAVFLALRRLIPTFGLDVLMHVTRLTSGLTWGPRSLFLDAESELRDRAFGPAADPSTIPVGLAHVLQAPTTREEPLVPSEPLRKLDPDTLTRALAQGGAVARSLEHFEERTEQIAMLRAVSDAFNRARHLIVEAGTGTGKSLAYLLPALAFAAANNRRVVVSTNTINLQDQLYLKDLPDVLGAMGYEARAAVLKGRTNYLCLRRWVDLLRSEAHTPAEATLMVKTLFWIGQTTTGDRGELRLTPEELASWSRICSLTETCSPGTCSYHREGSCYVARARRAAEASHVVIVNHSLLLSDVVSKSHILPDYRHLVIDEAHHLEEEATRQLGVDISERSLMLPLQALTPTPTLDLAAALEASIDMLAHRDDGEPHRAESPMVKLRQCLADAAGDTGELFDAVQALVVGAQNSESTSTVRLTQSVRGRDTWALVEERWERLRGCLREVDHHATNLLDHIGAAADAGSEGATSLNTEWLAATQQLRTVCARLDSLICEAPEDMVCWASCNTSLGGGASTELHMVPLDVAQAMRDAFFEQKDAVVLTSATLTTEGSFDYMRQRLGAFEADELAVGSPFDYERGVLLVLPSDMPDPASPTYASRAADAVAEMAEALGGRTLALFTSYAQLRSVHGTIRARMERAQISLLAQGVDGSRTRLLQRFRSAERALLLGTASFWEGVDIPGEALSALIIGRLPFAVPVDPVFAARSEQFEAPFLEYALPQAVLRFKQGFGRLIRTKNDRGVVLVLDGRIVSKLYGSSFVNSLPTCTVKRAPVGTAAALAREWLAGDPIPILERGGSA